MMQLVRWLRSNLGSFILAILLALTVWIAATQTENPVEEADFDSPIPIEMVGLAPELVIVNDYSSQTTIRLRAQRDVWRSLSTDDIIVTADLTGLAPGTYQIPLDVEIAAQAIFVSASPAHIRVDIEESREREIPVHLDFDGQPAIGFRADPPTIEPASVLVRGPRSRVDLVSEVVAKVSLEQRRTNFEGEIALAALDSDGNPIEGVAIVPAEARVVVPILQELGYKEVAVVVRTTGQPASGYFVTSITSVPPSVTVRGDPEQIATIAGYVETTPVDISGLRDDLIQDVNLALPPGVSLVEQFSIKVLVTIAAQEGSRTERITVEAQGLPEGFTVVFSPPEVDLIVSGPLPVLDTLSAGDIRVLIDLTGFAPGVYQIEPNVVILRDEIVLESVLPTVIEVEIIEAPGPAPR